MGRHQTAVGGQSLRRCLFRYVSTIMLRVEQRSSGSDDETGHVSTCRNVKSQFGSVHMSSPVLRLQSPIGQLISNCRTSFCACFHRLAHRCGRGLLAVLAAWRYHVVNREIERGKVSADRRLVISATVMVALLSGAMIALVLLTAGQP